MSWREVVVENWPYKLAAVVLAVLLWLNVTGDERQEFPVTTEVEVQVQDEAWVLVDVSPQQVRTQFQGQRGLVMPRMPVITHVVDSVSEPRMTVELSPRMVRGYDRELDLRPVSVRPQRVELRLERRVERRVPVVPRVELSAAAGFAVLRPLLLQPDTVTVRGAESEVESLEALRTEEAVLEELRRDVTQELRLEVPENLSHVEWSPRSVLVTVEVDSLVERSVRRPLVLRGAAASAVAVSPDSVTVRLSGPRRPVGALATGSVLAYVSVESAPADSVALPVQVELPEGVQATASADPPQVLVRRQGGEAASGAAPGEGDPR